MGITNLPSVVGDDAVDRLLQFVGCSHAQLSRLLRAVLPEVGPECFLGLAVVLWLQFGYKMAGNAALCSRARACKWLSEEKEKAGARIRTADLLITKPVG